MNDVKSVIQFEDHVLKDFQFETKAERYLENNVDITPSLYIDESKKRGYLKLEFIVKQDVYSISGTLVGYFSYNDSLSEEQAEELLINNGITILFPYLRAIIGNITNTANIPPVVIPTFNIIEFLKSKNINEVPQE